MLGALDPLLRRVDRWVGSDVARHRRAQPRHRRAQRRRRRRLRARLCRRSRRASSVPRRPPCCRGRSRRCIASAPTAGRRRSPSQASRLAAHTGYAGADEWADAIVAQLAAREIEQDDAIDALHTACYLAEGVSAVPARSRRARAVRRGSRARRARRARRRACAPPAKTGATSALASLADAWKRSKLDVPIDVREGRGRRVRGAAEGRCRARREARRAGPSRTIRRNSEAHRNLGLALAQQGKVVDALAHLVRRHARASDADPVGRALPERQAARGDGRARLREPLVRARRSMAHVRRHRVRGDGQPAHGQGVRARVPARSRGVRRDAAQRVRRRARRGRRLRDVREDREAPAARRRRRHDVADERRGTTSRARTSAKASSTRRSSSPSARSKREPAARQHRARSRRRSSARRRRRRPTPTPRRARQGRARRDLRASSKPASTPAAAAQLGDHELARAARRAARDAVPVRVGEPGRGHTARARRRARGARRHRRHDGSRSAARARARAADPRAGVLRARSGSARSAIG